ncbi:MAG: long-chain fatty acid--CoA ligase [Marmoricola sp.]
MLDQGLGSWPARRARMTPDKPALVQAGRVTTYAELEHRSTRLALGLRERGVSRGDRVAFLGLNCGELVETMFAVAKLGAVFLPVNTRLAPPELRHVLEDSGARLLIWQAGFEAGVESAEVAGLELDRARILRDDGASLALLFGPEGTIDEPVGPEDLFMIQYTSGTSGRPKGVMLTHANITWNVFNLMVDVDLGSDEVALVTAPLFHTAALNQVLFPTILKGGTALIEAKFDPDRAIELIEQEGVTLLFGVTSMYLAIAATKRFAEADLSTLRSALSGGAPIPQSLLQVWLDRGLMITQGYGLTESSPGATMLRAADGARKLGSAGTACFFTDVRVVTPTMDPVDVGEPGEVIVSGPNVTSGYWQNPAATAEAFTEGWLRTGDLAVVDDEGFLTIVDRLKDMYISGGENVYPAEVEQAIHTHPAIAEAAVIGVPDERWGEVGRAVVTVHEGAELTEEELLAHLEGRLARYKIPKSVVVVRELPHNASGKLVKSRLKEMHE